jgi:hypothetical protein
MPVRIGDQAPQYLNITGDELLVGGTITSYLSGTSTLQATKTDSTLATDNSNPLQIDSQGRVADMWTGVPLTLVLADASGAIIWTRDDVQSPLEIPTQAGQQGKFLSTNGTALEWDSISEVPDVTGQTGKVLSNDGTDSFWFTLPTPAAPGITAAANAQSGITATATAGGGAGTLLIQTGKGTIAASGVNQANGTIAFPQAFTTIPVVQVTLTTGSACASGFPVPNATSPSLTGCGVSFNNSRDAASGGAITGTVTYNWTAIGLA